MTSTRSLLFIIVTLVTPVYVHGSGLRCKAMSGCDIKCEASQTSGETSEFPITCESDGTSADDGCGKDVIKLKQDLESLRGIIKDQDMELEKLREDYAAIQTPSDKDLIMKKSVNKLSENLSNMKEMIRRHEMNATKTKEDIEALQSWNVQLEGDVAGLKTDVTGLRGMNSLLQSEVSKIKFDPAEFDKYRSKTDNLEVDMRTVSNKVDEHKKKQDKLEKDLKLIKKTNEENEQKWEERFEELSDDVSVLTEDVVNITANMEPFMEYTRKLRESPTPTPSTPLTSKEIDNTTLNTTDLSTWCNLGGFRYNDSCYWVEIKKEFNVTFGEVETVCENKNSTLAYPVDESHYEMLMSEVRKRIPEQLTWIYVWTGIEQNPETKELSVPGEQLPYVKWGEEEPDWSQVDTNVMLMVHKDAENIGNGLQDSNPDWGASGAICMYNVG